MSTYDNYEEWLTSKGINVNDFNISDEEYERLWDEYQNERRNRMDLINLPD